MGKMFDDLKKLFGLKETTQEENLFPIDSNETIVNASDADFIEGIRLGKIPTADHKV